MGSKKSPKMVHCRYPKCKFLHETTELRKEDAVQSGSKSYYHSDCYHTLQTVNKIRDLFIREIDPTLTGKQIGALVSIINNIVFSKKVNVDFVKFALEYYIKNKPGWLKYPGGLHYIIQNKAVSEAWKKLEHQKIQQQMNATLKQLTNILDDDVELDFGTEESKFKASKNKKFSSVLGA